LRHLAHLLADRDRFSSYFLWCNAAGANDRNVIPLAEAFCGLDNRRSRLCGDLAGTIEAEVFSA
jgi:hypothetical protein